MGKVLLRYFVNDTYYLCLQIASNITVRRLYTPNSVEDGILWKSNDVPPWQRTDCLSDRADKTSASPLDQDDRQLSNSMERICHRVADSCYAHSQDSVAIPHPPASEPPRAHKDCRYRRHHAFGGVATSAQGLRGPQVNRSIGIVSSTDQ